MKGVLFIIPARGGSKGIPGKNIKILGNKPLIQYSIAIAREFVSDEMICVSTDDEGIKSVCESLGLTVPFLRPKELSTDTAGTYDVLLHAVNFYLQKGIEVNTVVLLQPTSPFRKKEHLAEAFSNWNEDTEMIVGVKKTKANPYYVLMEENEKGYLEISKKAQNIERRQSVPPVYEINGALYIISANKLLKEKSLRDFIKVKKFEMDEVSSVDIDEPLDWAFAETIINKGFFEV